MNTFLAGISTGALLTALVKVVFFGPAERTPQWAKCPEPWTPIQRGDGVVVGMACYVNDRDGRPIPARTVWFVR